MRDGLEISTVAPGSRPDVSSDTVPVIGAGPGDRLGRGSRR